jgi:D-alanyl-D-alanine carboxypeptidase (penicillin-binding protein 5/6)
MGEHMPGKKTGLCILLSLLLLLPAGAVAGEKEPFLAAGAVVLMDANNGQVLYQKNMRQRMFPASTTKILTAVIALEKGNLSERVIIPEEACRVDGSAIGLQEGERLTLEDLLYALMLASANDAAESIALHLAGSIQNFSVLMNDQAKSIGAQMSNFTNPHGLAGANHYTTAYDLALITRYALENPSFRKIVRTRWKVISRPDADRTKGPPQEHLWNHNRFLGRYDGAIGVKTGYTVEAGQCLVAAAQKGDRELIAIILNGQGGAIYSDAGTILDYGFTNFEPLLVVRQREKISTVNVSRGMNRVDLFAGDSFHYNFPLGQPQDLVRRVQLDQGIKAPLVAGQKVGELILSADGQEVGRVCLITMQPVERFPGRLWLFLITGLVIIFIPFTGIRRTARRKRRPLSRRRF